MQQRDVMHLLLQGAIEWEVAELKFLWHRHSQKVRATQQT